MQREEILVNLSHNFNSFPQFLHWNVSKLFCQLHHVQNLSEKPLFFYLCQNLFCCKHYNLCNVPRLQHQLRICYSCCIWLVWRRWEKLMSWETWRIGYIMPKRKLFWVDNFVTKFASFVAMSIFVMFTTCCLQQSIYVDIKNIFHFILHQYFKKYRIQDSLYGQQHRTEKPK